ncbi:unnamed protein product [Cuscuta campestris]|uniref:Uncharacterized protein n=1 Tax=Cuscuta campestris TaxID=132261 RepID=A0A484N4F5_9ASTE|nr:unnamed protein product [Cuscuta campestris]
MALNAEATSRRRHSARVSMASDDALDKILLSKRLEKIQALRILESELVHLTIDYHRAIIDYQASLDLTSRQTNLTIDYPKRMSQAAGNDGQVVPHEGPEHVSVHTEASSFTPQQVPEQAAPGAGPVPEVVLINQPQFAANFMNFLQQLAGTYVPPPPPPPPPVAVVTIEKLRKNGAEEFLGDQIADPMIAK